MYPNLRYAFYDLLGLDIPALALVQTYGFFLALTFVACGLALNLDLKRREKLGLLEGVEEEKKVGEPLSIVEVLTNALLGFVFGFKGFYAIMDPMPFVGNNAKDYLLSMEHGSWLGGIVLALLFAYSKYREKQQELKTYPTPQTIKEVVMPHQRVSDIIIIAAISGIIGAKLLYMTEVEYVSWEAAMKDFFSGSGLTVYGGFILAFFVVSYYIKSKKIPLNQMVDACAPAMILGTGLGRLGCHFSGDGDWGDPNRYTKPYAWIPDWLWGYRYPNNVINEGMPMEDCFYPDAFGNYCHILKEPVFPTPIYELIICLIIFAILWSIRHRVKVHGIVFSVYLIFTGLERFLLEMIRINDDYSIAGLSLSQAQYIAMVLFAIGIVLTAVLWNKQRKMPE